MSSEENIFNMANYPAGGNIKYCPPPDKSISIRAILLAAFAKGKSIIYNPLECDDTQAAIACVRVLGAEITEKENTLEISGGNILKPEKPIYCGSSGTLARLLCGLLSGSGIEAEICGSAQLSSRPMRRITEPLRLMGANIKGDSLPLKINPSSLHGIDYNLPMASATVKTGLLFAGINASGKTVIKEPFPSRNHGEKILEKFGCCIKYGNMFAEISRSVLNPCEIKVPGDFSSAAFFIAGAQLAGHEINVIKTGLNPSRLGMMNVLKRAGADFELHFDEECNEPSGSIIYRPSELRPLYARKEEIPSMIDEIPALAVIAAAIPGESVFCGIDELKVKESDRAAAIIRLAKAMGAAASYAAGTLRICGAGRHICGLPEAAYMPAGADHRMAMAAAAAQLHCPGLRLASAECVSKSYPGFFADFQNTFGINPKFC